MLSKLSDPLVVDSGNALFRFPGPATEADKPRAALVLSTMGALKTKVMAVGQRDLAAGVSFLTDAAKQAKVQLVSTNLEQAGSPAFSRSVVLEHRGVKVAFLSVSGVGPVPAVEALIGVEPIAALKAELARLPKRDLTVLLAAGGYTEAMSIADTLPGVFDLVIQSGEFRGTVPPQLIRDTYLLASGQRGQAVAAVELVLGPGKRFADLNEANRDSELLANLDAQLATLDGRVKAATDAAAKRDLGALRAQMKTRRDEQAARVKTALGGKTLKLDWMLLGQDVKDDEAIKAEVLKVEPTYAGNH